MYVLCTVARLEYCTGLPTRLLRRGPWSEATRDWSRGREGLVTMSLHCQKGPRGTPRSAPRLAVAGAGRACCGAVSGCGWAGRVLVRVPRAPGVSQAVPWGPVKHGAVPRQEIPLGGEGHLALAGARGGRHGAVPRHDGVRRTGPAGDRRRACVCWALSGASAGWPSSGQ